MWLNTQKDIEENEEEKRKAYEQGKGIALTVLNHAKKELKPGVSIRDYAEGIEKLIREEKAEPGFPVNISINEVAAHYTPGFGDENIFEETMVVKVDMGISVQGYVVDYAFTKDFSGNNGKLLEAAANALRAAVENSKAGAKAFEIGQKIQDQIETLGFKPIANLSGHMLKKNQLHAGVSIPNIGIGDSYALQEGDSFAIEPFASMGNGFVAERDEIEILSLDAPKPVRLKTARDMSDYIKKNHPFLPFAERWLFNHFKSRLTVSTGLRELLVNGSLIPYPVLADTELVSQFETTVIIGKDEPEAMVDLEELFKGVV